MSPTQPTGWVEWHAAIPICSFCGRSGYDRRLDHKSRMGREFHVRFREGLGVKFPRATRLVVLHRDEGVIKECHDIAQQWLSGMGLELKPSKTRIAHTLHEVDGTVGFDFLSFTIRQFPV